MKSATRAEAPLQMTTIFPDPAGTGIPRLKKLEEFITTAVPLDPKTDFPVSHTFLEGSKVTAGERRPKTDTQQQRVSGKIYDLKKKDLAVKRKRFSVEQIVGC